MRETKLHPLYPTADYLSDLQMKDFPTLKDFLSDGQSWRKKHWLWGQSFLVYVARNKSPHTFNRFRNEIERFLLWLFLKHDQPMDKLKKVDILQFADFCWAPDIRWIGVSNHRIADAKSIFPQMPGGKPIRLRRRVTRPLRVGGF